MGKRRGEGRGRALALAMAATATLADQLSKRAALAQLAEPPRTIELTPFLNLTLGFNRGVSFGLFSSSADLGWLLILMALAIVACLLVWAWYARGRAMQLALGAIIGGAISNVIDRVRQGAVTDFMDLHAFGWHWPTFNLADVFIVCGVAALLVLGWRDQGAARSAHR